MDDDLHGKLLSDVLRTGFPAELKTRAALAEAGWQVTGNTYFLDLDEGKGRELDLEAHINSYDHEGEPSVCVWSTLAVEVKQCDKPWVVFSSPREDLDTAGYRLLHHDSNITSQMLPYEVLIEKQPDVRRDRIARSGHVAFSKGENSSVLFGALVSACKAAHSMHRSAAAHKEAYSDDSLDLCFYTPVVVLHGRLFECFLDESGETTVVETDRIPFNLNYLSSSYEARTYFAAIVTSDALGDYCNAHRGWITSLQHHLSSVVRA